MSWQDLAFGAGGYILAASLLPTLVSRSRPPRITSIMMTVIIAVFAVADASLSLWIATSGMIVQIALWSAIAIRGPSRPQLVSQ